MKNLSRGAIFFIFLFLGSFAKAVNAQSVVINEIAWMGTDISANDEWIELYNNTESPINLDGWQLASQDGTPEINLSGIISANGFYLLERTNDNTVLNITADLIYKGALGNNGEDLKLYDNLNNVIIDEINCSTGWSAGNNTTKQTMEKIPAGWQTSQTAGGTPKDKNSIIIQAEPQPQAESAESAVDVKHQQPIIYPSGIVFNEILPSPEGPDSEEEWIEIFNQNSFEVNLSNWQITDINGSAKTYIFPEGTEILQKGFLVLARPTTKITLNNDSDGLKLLQPGGKVTDEISYEKAPRGQSYNRTVPGWAWSTILTPGSPNIVPSPISETKEVDEPKEEVKEQPPEKETRGREAERKLAAIGEQIPEKSSFLPLLIALAIAIFSGAIILTIKRKIKSFDLSKKLE